MSLCINPKCSQPENQDQQLFCQSCGSELLLAGRYQVMRLLSDKGGFGNTYEVSHNHQLKVLKVLTNNHPKAIELFHKEADVLSQLNHPGIPKGEGIFNYFPRNSQTPLYCLVMEKIEGMDLEEYQKQRNNQPIDQILAIEWLLQLANILNEVHSHNFFHRDIKPSNIILRADGQLTLIDFGAVRQVTATILGGGQNTGIFTPGFAPPEQEKGYAVPQSDFYALGRTFVYLLTGKSPVHPDIYDRYNDTLNWRGHAPQIIPELADFIDYLMADKANNRPQSTTLILQKLQEISAKVKPISQLPLTKNIPIISPTIVSKNPEIQSNINQTVSPINRRKALKIMGLTAGSLLIAVGIEQYLSNRSNDNSSNQNGSNNNGNKPNFDEGETVTVTIDGSGDYTSISEAIKNVSANSIIMVKPGLYQEFFIINKPLEIIGEGEKETVIIQCSNSYCFAMQTDYATVKNMTFKRLAGTEETDGYTIDIAQGNLVLEACDITSESLACIGIYGINTTPEISFCSIHGSTKGSGVYIYENAKGLITDCEIYDNAFSGVAITSSADPLIKNSNIYNCKGNGFYSYENGKGSLENCNIYGNEASGISIYKFADPSINQCTINHGGIFIDEDGKGTIKNCQILDTTFGSGIEIANRGNPYISNCKISDGKNSGIYVHDYGTGSIENCEIFNHTFHGISIINYGSPYVNQCKIYSNLQVGILCYQNGLGTIEKSEIYQNIYSGIEIRENGNLTLQDCKINQNKEHGLYIHDQGQGTMTNCDLTGNGFEGLNMDDTSQLQQNGNQL